MDAKTYYLCVCVCVCTQALNLMNGPNNVMHLYLCVFNAHVAAVARWRLSAGGLFLRQRFSHQWLQSSTFYP